MRSTYKQFYYINRGVGAEADRIDVHGVGAANDDVAVVHHFSFAGLFF